MLPLERRSLTLEQLCIDGLDTARYCVSLMEGFDLKWEAGYFNTLGGNI